MPGLACPVSVASHVTDTPPRTLVAKHTCPWAKGRMPVWLLDSSASSLHWPPGLVLTEQVLSRALVGPRWVPSAGVRASCVPSGPRPSAPLLGCGCVSGAACPGSPLLFICTDGHPGRLGCGACCCRGASSGGVKAGNRVPGSLHTAHGQSAGGWPCPVQCCPTPCSLEEGSLGRTRPLLWRVPHEAGGGPGILTNLTGFALYLGVFCFLGQSYLQAVGCASTRPRCPLRGLFIYLSTPGHFGGGPMCAQLASSEVHTHALSWLWLPGLPQEQARPRSPGWGRGPVGRREGRLARVTPAQPCPSRPEA